MLKILLFVAFALCVSAIPIPDTSSECLSCKAFVNAMDIAWSNVTTIDQILKELDAKCVKNHDSVAEIKMCQALANVFVQIPPALFEGMADLAWPMPEAPCALLFKCHVNCCGPLDPPEQVHLSLASNDRSIMGVTWVSLNLNTSVVQYGTQEHRLTETSVGTVGTAKAGGWIGNIHRAVMTSLQPGTTYYYRVGDGEHRWSEVLSFKTLVPGQNVTFGVLADIDFESNATFANMISLVEKGAVDVVLINGDESYSDGYEPHWDLFFNRMQRVGSRVPIMVTAGNHEFWYNFSAYKHRFFMPGVLDEGGSGDGMFYSMNVGHAHVVMGNSETAIDTANFSASFLKWMDEDLANVDRTQTNAVITLFHRPLYCSNNDRCTTDGGDKLRRQAEEILYQHKVHLVVTSHIHSYERMYPIYHNVSSHHDYDFTEATPYSGPAYILMGSSGNREGNHGPYNNVPEWSAFNDPSIAFALMTVSENAIDWSFYASRMDEDGGPVLKDTFTLSL